MFEQADCSGPASPGWHAPRRLSCLGEDDENSPAPVAPLATALLMLFSQVWDLVIDRALVRPRSVGRECRLARGYFTSFRACQPNS